MELLIRDAVERDERFLWEMLGQAVAWRPTSRVVRVEELRESPSLSRYVSGWGRSGDVGLIAEANRMLLGAAWWRLFTDQEYGYGFVDPSVPELSMAVVARSRGGGVGTALLNALLDRAGERGIAAISLSVEQENPARRLYERIGFRQVGRAGNALTMLREIRG